MTTTVNLLHLSDLHFRKRGFSDQTLILDAFKEDLKIICDGPLKPDLVVFTGDLVQAADDPDVYLHLYDDLLSDVIKITRCNESRFFFCPGNHDAHRVVIQRQWHLQSGLEANLNDREHLNSEYTDAALSTLVRDKFGNFTNFKSCCLKPMSFMTTESPLSLVSPIDDRRRNRKE